MIEILSTVKSEFTSVSHPDDTVPYDKGTKITGNHNLTKKYISRNCQLKMFLTPFYWLQKSKKKLQSILMIQSLFSNRESYCLGVLDDYQPILSIDADLNDPRSVIQYGLDVALETAISSLRRYIHPASDTKGDCEDHCWAHKKTIVPSAGLWYFEDVYLSAIIEAKKSSCTWTEFQNIKAMQKTATGRTSLQTPHAAPCLIQSYN